MQILLFFVLIVLEALLFIIATLILIGVLLSEKGYRGSVSDHFNGKRFFNEKRSLLDRPGSGLKYGLKRNPEKGINNYETFVRLKSLPLPDSNKIHVTFVNHSTFIIQVGHTYILTDPIWSQRCSPVQWAGPARYRPPGVKLEDIDRVDIILLSHNHYDHLDLPTLKKIKEKHNPIIITPLGVSAMLKKRNFKNLRKMDWWEDMVIGDLKITSTPANHFSARGISDRNKTLWCGYTIEYLGFKIYYVGDTGYGNIFKKIGEHFGSMDLSLIPIGAYMPRWFMSPIHIDPEEAIKVHLDVNSKQSIAMHFGTFPLADDGPTTAPREMIKALKRHEINSPEFIIPDEGFSYSYDVIG